MLTKTPRTAKADRLRALEAFRGCSAAELADLERSTTEISLPAGHELCRQGGIGQEAFVIEEGAAEVSIDGRTVATLGPGDVVGEMALLERQPRTATVTALTPLRVVVLSVREFGHVIEDLPTTTRRLAETLAGRLRATNELAIRR